jgi:hypothetical protein
MKNSKLRITETIQFIRTATLTPQSAMEKRASVAKAVENWCNSNALAADQISVAMSQAKARNRPGSEIDRSYRRAIILISFVTYPVTNYSATDTAANVNNLITTGYAEALGKEVNTASDILSLTSQLGLGSVYDLLLSDPDRFLTEKKVKVSVAPSNKGGSQEYAFYFEPVKGVYEFNSIAGAGRNPYKKIMAYIVPAINWHQIPTYPKIVPTVVSSGTPPLIITTQFTGCSLCYQKNGAGLLVAHVSPDGNNSDTSKKKQGAGMGAELINGDGFVGYAKKDFNVYVRDEDDPKKGYGKTDAMYIFGVHSAESWKLWSQHVYKNSKHVYQIYPKLL